MKDKSIGTHIGDISTLLYSRVHDIENHLRKIEKIGQEVAFTVCTKRCKYGSEAELLNLGELPECKDCPIFQLY